MGQSRSHASVSKKRAVCNQEPFSPAATPHFFSSVHHMLGSWLARPPCPPVQTLAPVFPVRMDKTSRSGPPLTSCETNVGVPLSVSSSLKYPETTLFRSVAADVGIS
ncbi:uncharacterized protein F4822DRAFT_61424 [Hypoxylon trugodes]|uniref:uncharacterized protein n=1 Tax=Hypoxylon trugodes TaxID=326681 RepID=UPI00219F6FD0|nr:uncharacterized protein F4822DRAFT_61424 [Hypoxylon trugodes]KAI1384109.1 hypothetical protein F4822DRAFT_61424 [Hypoxylon trugodes]